MTTIVTGINTPNPTAQQIGTVPNYAIHHDYTGMIKTGLVALAVIVGGYFVISTISSHLRYEGYTGLAEEIIRHDRIEAPDLAATRSHEHRQKRQATADLAATRSHNLDEERMRAAEKRHAEDREQSAALATMALERPTTIIRGNVPAPSIVQSGCCSPTPRIVTTNNNCGTRCGGVPVVNSGPTGMSYTQKVAVCHSLGGVRLTPDARGDLHCLDAHGRRIVNPNQAIALAAY